jgi:hypothetical protein
MFKDAEQGKINIRENRGCETAHSDVCGQDVHFVTNDDKWYQKKQREKVMSKGNGYS